MSDEENERFDVDNDYEGMQWIGGEAFFANKRKKRQQTAEDRIYGVFAENSSDDEDERRRGRKREKKDYAKPVDFVSSGSFVQQPPEEQQQATKPEQRPAASKAKQSEAGQNGAASNGASAGLGSAGLGFGGGGVGLGFGGGGGGLGFAPAGGAGIGAGSYEAEEEEVVLPSAFGKKIKRAAEERRQAEQQASAKGSKGRAATATPGLAPTGDFATFEKHTKGIGLKLLSKMGFKAGQGLGREGTGIARPLETKLRPKNMGLGAGRFEEAKMELPKTAAQEVLAAAAAAEEVEEGSAAARAGGKASTSGSGAGATKLWKRRAAPQRQARTYKTAAEVLAEAAEKPAVMQQPILDMRGPQARLVTNLEHLNVGDGGGEGSGAGGPPMPELQHNLTLLVDLTQAQLQQLDAKLQHEQDTATLLAAEKTRLEAEAARQEAALSRLANLASDVARAAAHAPTSSLHHLRAAYAAMQAAYPQEYVMYSISSAALAHALPHFGALMRGWAPLQEPSRGAEEFGEWRVLLEGEGARHAVLSGADGLGGEGEDAYVALVLEVLMPAIRSAVTTTWQARMPEPMLALIETWEPLLPRSITFLILNSLVMPKLTAAVGTWEPRQEAVPIHAWLHPWLPHLGTALESVYPSIRHKLSLALSAWHPSDGSAALLLAPWQRAFAAADWEALLTRSIAPKLAEALNELVVNPLAQDLEPLNWVLAWHGLLPGRVMAGLLDAGFFPRWHAVLRHWLSGSPNFDEVTRWYLGWKGLFPQDLLDQERVRTNFNHALNMMNSAADGAPLPPLAPTGATAGLGAGAAAAAAGAPVSGGRGGFVPELSLRDLVARFAEESGVEFLPKPGRYHDGLQVYSFGGVSVVLDAVSSVVRAQIRERWAPVSLDRLLQDARARSKK